MEIISKSEAVAQDGENSLLKSDKSGEENKKTNNRFFIVLEYFSGFAQ